MSFSPMKNGIGKVECLLCSNFSFIKWLDSADVDCFNNSSTADFNCAIGIDFSDGERSSSGCSHLWLASAFITVKDD